MISWKSLLNLLSPQPHSKLVSTLPTSTTPNSFHYLFSQISIFTVEPSIHGSSIQHLSYDTSTSLVLVIIEHTLWKIPTLDQYKSPLLSVPTLDWLDSARENITAKWDMMSSRYQSSSQCCSLTVCILILPIFSQHWL